MILAGSKMTEIQELKHIIAEKEAEVRAVIQEFREAVYELKAGDLLSVDENPETVESQRCEFLSKMEQDPEYKTRLDSPEKCIAFFDRYDLTIWRKYGCCHEKGQIMLYEQYVKDANVTHIRHAG